MIDLYNEDNMKIFPNKYFDYIYADYIYENLDFSWFRYWWKFLNKNGVFVCQTDYHSNHRIRVYIEDNFPDAVFVNEIVEKCEWGNHDKRT